MVAAVPLSEEDLAAVRAELAAGKPVTVWFTSAAVGVPAGGSAKMVAIDDAAEGDFIQVRPAGTRDTMFCSPNELTRVRPPRKRTRRQDEPAPETTAARPVESPPARPAPPDAEPEQRSERKPEPKPERSRAASTRPADVTVTLNSTAEGEWTVEVVVGKKRRVRPTPVQPAEVAQAARALPPAVAEAIESSLEAARRRQAERVERLRAELEAAQRALRELNG